MSITYNTVEYKEMVAAIARDTQEPHPRLTPTECAFVAGLKTGRLLCQKGAERGASATQCANAIDEAVGKLAKRPPANRKGRV